MFRLICQKPAHFFVCPNGFGELVSTFFQMFIVLGVYNFGMIGNSVQIYALQLCPNYQASAAASREKTNFGISCQILWTAKFL